MNPFIISGYHSAKYFCDREKETKKLLNSIKNNRNVTIFSLRKIGKTGLIRHVFSKLNESKEISTFYIDIMPTRNLQEFIYVLGNEIIGKPDNKPLQIIKKAGQVFSKLRPQISYDVITGQPQVSFIIQNEADSKAILTEMFKYLDEQSRKKKIVVAIDEFQQIINYPENNVEELLRSMIQRLKNVVFIFSGSQKHLLLNMFGDVKRPFYNSTELLQLEKINRKEYSSFIQARFESRKYDIQTEDIDFILDWTQVNTFNVQYVCNKIYGNEMKKIKHAQIIGVLVDIMNENEAYYFSIKKLISRHQWDLLTAIAKEKKATSVLGKDFADKYKLSPPSTIQRSLDALLTKELIYEDNGFYSVYDVFFGNWLAMKMK